MRLEAADSAGVVVLSVSGGCSGTAVSGAQPWHPAAASCPRDAICWSLSCEVLCIGNNHATVTSNLNAIAGEPAVVRSRMAGDPHRPGYHFLPPSGQMQDIDGGLYWRGRYHMLFLCHPVYPGGPAHWGHTVSADMVHWSDLPYALAPEPGTYDEHGIWSGGMIDADGVASIVYTGKPRPGTYHKEPASRPETQCLATSSDDYLVHWRKHPANPVIATALADLDVTAFRDPSCGARMTAGGC